MRATVRFAIVTALVLAAGCSFLTPKTYQLEQIHESYTSEWAQSSLPATGSSRPQIVDGGESFKNTLAAIHNYKVTHGSDTRVAAHLTVLEGMTYLQAGKPGMAHLLASDIATAMPKLRSSTGVAARDYVFAKSFLHLVAGWKAILDIESDPTKYSLPADALVMSLKGLNEKERAGAQVDSGGAYVATSAAIFYVWSHAASPTTHTLKDMAKKGAAALKLWLTEREITAAEDNSYDNRGMEWGSRTRYVRWYAWLHANS